MVNIAIVEDEAMYAKQLQEFLLQYQKENGEVFNITVVALRTNCKIFSHKIQKLLYCEN